MWRNGESGDATILGQMSDQEFHLVGQDIAIRQDEMFYPARTIRHGQKRHSGLLRRTATFVDIAGKARGDAVFPRILTAFGQGDDVIASEIAAAVMFAAVQAEHSVAREQRGVGQCRCGFE